MSDRFSAALSELKERPKRLTDIRLWLFVTVNTAEALIAGADKNALGRDLFSGCASVAEIQYQFDMIQGMYGRRLSSKRDERYNYLCSLVAFFSDRELSESEQGLAGQFRGEGKYLLYEL